VNFLYKYRLLKTSIIILISNFTHLQALVFVNTVGKPARNEHLLTLIKRRPDDGNVRTETFSKHLLTGLVGRPDHIRLRTEIFSKHLLTGLLRRPDDGHVRTETCSFSQNKYDLFDENCFIISISISTSLCFCSTYFQQSSKLLWF
jgi:hypothetical protein